MIQEKLARDATARVADRRAWDDGEEVDPDAMVDDTDGLEPEAEFAAWKLRELKRLKRDRDQLKQREEAIEEIERRRNLSQAERDAEDRDHLEQQRKRREEGRGKAGFLQRYHHKGAFFQDDERAENLRERDLMGARFEDEVKNREALPHYMQIRDMTKLGKKGKTRYMDLKAEDTGNWGQGYDSRERNGSALLHGVDERFRPDLDSATRQGGNGPTGANASAIQERMPNIAEMRPRSTSANHDDSRHDLEAMRISSRKRGISQNHDNDKRMRLEV